MASIDIHTHAFPDNLASRAIKTLEALAPWQAVGNGTIDGLLKSMDAADIDVSVICSIATKPDQVEPILKWCQEVRTDRLEPLPSVHPDARNPVKWIRRIAQAGFAGVKLHPLGQGFAFDDPRMLPIYEALSAEGLILVTHCGRDVGFPPDDDRAGPARIRQVADRFTDLTLVCTHMGGWESWDAAEEHLIGADVHIETSFSLQFLDADRAARMIRRHGVQRVLFGTDWPWSSQAGDVRRLRRLPLTQDEVRQILWANAARLLGY